MEELAKLKSKKGVLKGKVTRIENYLNAIEINKINDNIINEIQIRLEKLKPLFDEFEDMQFQIEQLTSRANNSEIQSDETERGEFEEKYFKLYGEMNALINSHNKPCANSNSTVQTTPSQNINSLQSLVKLPPIKLPNFDGQYSNWLEFKDSFNALVDSNNALNDVQKFYYLRSSLSKDVLEVIKSLEVTDANYNVAWRFLNERFENKKLIIHNHISAIYEHPKLLKESYNDLRNLYDSITKHLRALNSLGENTDAWDSLIIYIMSSKFDYVTRREWENYKCVGNLPKMSDLNNFLKNKCEVLEKLEASQRQDAESQKYNKQQVNKKHSRGLTSSYSSVENSFTKFFKCYYCQGSHSIFKCGSFLKLSVNNRISAIKQLKLCLNCFNDKHPSWKCIKSKCTKCQKAHNSILHLDSYNNNSEQNSIVNRGENKITQDQTQGITGKENVVQQIANSSLNSFLGQRGAVGSQTQQQTFDTGHTAMSAYSQVLLSTAMIKVINGNKTIFVRALLDSGSQSNFVSQNVCNALKLNQVQINHAVKGVGQSSTSINSQVNLTIKSCIDNKFSVNINCLVLPSITEKLPILSFSKEILRIPANLELADPKFNVAGDVEILLGSDIFWSVLGSRQLHLGPNLPILRETKFGYVIGGNLSVNKSSFNDSSLSCFNLNEFNQSLDKILIRFWEIEELNINKSILSEAEQYCEDYFAKTTTRSQMSGRFVVRVPFKKNLNLLGDSRKMALKRFFLLEKKLNKNMALRTEYVSFMSEYQDLGHMSLSDDIDSEGYYLPHHAILRETSITTKCRVVFDASAKTTSGLSLNDVQYCGPTLQQDVFSILTRFRMYKYVMTGDISKMYRQILVDPDETKYQKIFWRSQINEEVKVFKLNTVTYGTASAPYLAVKCLFQIANDNENSYPLASKIIKRDFYMDDLLTGSNSISELIKIQGEIFNLLANYGFQLRKFLCNKKELLEKFEVDKNLDVNILNIGENEQNKTLGIYWDANNDYIRYKINKIEDFSEIKLTKRVILSLISQVFDPLGLLGPIIIVAKLIIQELWKLKIDWDDEIPQGLIIIWSSFYNNFSDIVSLKIPRFAIFSQYVTIELHGFSDASIKAYGACIYLRCSIFDGSYLSNLLCAKSRVAPIKQVSLPRLELCGALLLANLYKRITDILEINFNKTYFWSDSTITLCWIRNESNKWKTFVANRVSEIRSLTKFEDWHYVKSGENPADLLSRGASIEVLSKSILWWYGPEWFSESEFNWNLVEPKLEIDNLCEQRTVSCFAVFNHSNEIISILEKFSRFQKTLGVVAFIMRFVNYLKNKFRNSHPLQPEEIDNALKLIIKNVQILCFPDEYSRLYNKKELRTSSKILSLNPFLDNGVLRVGGRIRNSCQPFEIKHPIILPNNHFLTTQILRQEHERLLHCGVQNLLYSIRERYWPISGRNACKKVVRSCIRCFRVSPRDSQYIMGDLPRVRVTPGNIFTNVGTDFGGPFLLKDRQTRGAKIVKGYICLFICMSTKAVHIELVSDLTTEAFLAAFKRFISRRGRPANVYSDNGSNYRGANTELLKVYEFLTRQSEKITDQLCHEYIKWHFIPASSPSFGGIWEAGIKSAKSHIKRVIGETRLTFEEFTTVLTQIEGVLNSRPLCPLTHEPDDLSVLTPGHFLIGKPLTCLPELNATEIPINRLSKWQHLQALTQHFWRRWQKEYLSELQTRIKWKQKSTNLIKVGTLVLLKNENAPPLQWQLGRVHSLCPGHDGVVRVVKLKVNDGILTRAINRVCALPSD